MPFAIALTAAAFFWGGVWLLIGGLKLALLGGSIYYLLAGAALMISSIWI